MKLTAKNNDQGMVLVTVVMVTLVMSLLLTAIISQNLSQVSVTQSQIDQIKAQELAVGGLWKAQAEMTNVQGNVAAFNETLDGKVFTITPDPKPSTAASSHPAYNVTVTYTN